MSSRCLENSFLTNCSRGKYIFHYTHIQVKWLFGVNFKLSVGHLFWWAFCGFILSGIHFLVSNFFLFKNFPNGLSNTNFFGAKVFVFLEFLTLIRIFLLWKEKERNNPLRFRWFSHVRHPEFFFSHSVRQKAD